MSKNVVEKLGTIGREIEEANQALKSPDVKKQDIHKAFEVLVNAEDHLWDLRDEMDDIGIGYLTLRQVDELLTDLDVEYSLPSIQLLLRVLLQSRLLDSEEAQKRITMASNNLRRLQAALASLQRQLRKADQV